MVYTGILMETIDSIWASIVFLAEHYDIKCYIL